MRVVKTLTVHSWGTVEPRESLDDYVRVDDDVLLMQGATRSIINMLVNLR